MDNLISNTIDGTEEAESLLNVESNNDSLDESIISQSVCITSYCSGCNGVTSKKDRSLECGNCKSLTHYRCSNLPGYVIHALKTSKR